MARGKAADLAVMPRDFSQQLAAAERQAVTEFDPAGVGEEGLSDDLALSNTLAQIGEDESNAKVYVYKIDAKTQRDVFAFETTPSEFATGGLTEIGKRYGGGDYRVRVYADGKVLTHRRVSIMEQKEIAPNPVTSIVPEIQNAMAQQNQMMLEGFRAIADAMKAQQPPVAPSFMEQMQAFASLQNIFGAKQQGPDFGQMIDMLKQGMEIGRSSGEQSTLDVLMRGIETFGPVLADAVKNNPAPQPIQQTAQIPAPASVPQIAAQPTSEDEMNMLREAMLKQSINFLVKQAEADHDPAVYAIMVMDQLDDENLRGFIDRADWLDFLAQYNPAIKNQPIAEWFGKLRVEIKSMLDDLTQEEKSGTSPGHAT